MERIDEDRFFEDEVRRIARSLWPQSEYDGAAMVKGRERDGLFETEECIHLIEATRSRSKAKAEQDVGKLLDLAREFRKKAGTKPVRCWFITQSEPTADQRAVLGKNRELVNILSFQQFESKLVDASAYLARREAVRFGSVRDPVTGVIIPKIKYVQLDLVESSTGAIWDVKQIAEQLLIGGRLLLLGDYGAGKSMTMREIFQELRKAFLKKKTPRFPIYINMRDHFGQTDPAEVLERHARQIGFSNPTHLVRAWRSGYGILLIDGFDEVTSLGVQGAWRRLRDTRFKSMEAIRKFVRETPQEPGIVIAGRPQFFDSATERNTSLGIDARFICLTLNEFTEQQIKDFMNESGCSRQIPSWMPMRPLLVAYLIARDLLADSGEASDNSPAEGWNSLIERIASREAEIEAGIDGATVRRILERLATKARSSQDGLGPITPEQVIKAFEEICGYSPDGQAMVLLQRLPGLGVDSSNPENRSFVDTDFADTCRAGDVVESIERPFDFDLSLFENSECCLDELGVSVAAIRLPMSNFPEGKLLAALQYFNKNAADRTLRTDVVRTAATRGDQIVFPMYIKDVVLNSWDFGSITGNISNVSFQESYIGQVGIDEDIDYGCLPKFLSCLIGRVDGRTQQKDLPANIFDEQCIFDSFSDEARTTDGILQFSLPLGSKVLLTILKKLYIQPGRGRRENALHRGLDQRSQRLVPAILELLSKEGLATCYRVQGKPIWFPDRRNMSRIGSMLATPHECKDPVFSKAGELS